MTTDEVKHLRDLLANGCCKCKLYTSRFCPRCCKVFNLTIKHLPSLLDAKDENAKLQKQVEDLQLWCKVAEEVLGEYQLSAREDQPWPTS